MILDSIMRLSGYFQTLALVRNNLSLEYIIFNIETSISDSK